MESSEYTGQEAQRDPDFAKEGMTVSEMQEKKTRESVVDDLESGLDAIDDFDTDEFKTGLSEYENFIVLPKRELAQFIRAVEPLTKSSVDQYGKSCQISCEDKDTVTLRYVNSPCKIQMKINNKSQKMVDPFCIHVSLLKKLVTEAYASLVIVFSEGEYNIAICDSLLFLETIPLSAEEYNFEKKETSEVLDKELGLYAFRKIGPILSTSDRASEKTIVVKGSECFINTGCFSAKLRSPFSEEDHDMLLFKSAVDLLGILMETSKVDVRYKHEKDLLVIHSDGLIYCEVPISDKIDDHYSSAVANSLKFEADIVIVNDSLSRLFSLVKSLDYVSDIVTVAFSKEFMTVSMYSTDMKRKSDYKFAIAEGTVDNTGEMKISADVMKPYIDVTGTDVKYAFNDSGLCMKNDKGSFIIRRTN